MVVSNMFYFHPDYIGNDPIWLASIFQRGWNHQRIYIYTDSIDSSELREEAMKLISFNLCFRWFFILPTMGCTIKSPFGNLGIERAISCFFQLFSRRKSKNQDPPSIQPKRKKNTQKKDLAVEFMLCSLHQEKSFCTKPIVIYGVIWDL